MYSEPESVSPVYETDSGSEEESLLENEPLIETAKKPYRWNLSDTEILAAKVAFVLSGSDPKKQNKWIIAADYWQKKGLLGLDRASFKKVKFF